MLHRHDNLSDPELVERMLAGDQAVFAWLVHKHHHGLVRLAMTFVGSRGVAEEVAQETWLAVIEGLTGFAGRGSLKGWIYRILANQAKRRGAREGRTINFSSLGGDDVDLDADDFDRDGMWNLGPGRWGSDTPERLLSDRQTLAVIDRAVSALPENQRAVVVLRDVLGTGSREVCEVLDISEANQRVLLHRGRLKVREALQQHLREDARG